MFSQPIVFVVGAGASEEFRMPLATQMNTNIGRALNFIKDSNGKVFGDQDLADALTVRFGGDAERYHAAATQLASRIGQFDSIDEALRWFSARPEIVELGKAAIVTQILREERGSKLFSSRDSAEIPSGDFSDTWLPLFLSMATGSLTKEEAANAFDNVTIINFNYDRIIEHFLFARLQTHFGLTAEEAVASISSLNVIRPYGSVGLLPWQSGDVPFGYHLPRNERLFTLANNVLTFTEQKLTAEVQSAIRSAMQSARRVIFLGFGFHQQNMEILRVPSAEPWRYVLATGLGIDPENHTTLQRQIAATVGCDPANVTILDRRSHRLLETMKPSIMATF
jgi:hypothetical protein